MEIPEEELIRRLRSSYDAFNRGDFDAATEWVHPEIVFITLSPGRTEIRGREAFRAWMEPDAFESQAVSGEIVELARDKALIHQQTRARGAGSGIEIEIGSWTVWTIDDEGRVIRIENFLEHEEDEAMRVFRDEN
jgi:ketosteroid isomerase-like protein